MGVYDGRARVIRTGKDLFAKWDRTKEGWRDETCLQFEKKYLIPLQAELHRTQQAMDRMTALLYRLRQECR